MIRYQVEIEGVKYHADSGEYDIHTSMGVFLFRERTPEGLLGVSFVDLIVSALCRQLIDMNMAKAPKRIWTEIATGTDKIGGAK